MISVGMGEIRVSSDPDTVLSCLGLGSCIALCAYDPVAKVSGLAHIVLPECNRNTEINAPGKFATTAVPSLIDQMTQLGARANRLVIKLTGGAQMIQSDSFNLVIQIGQRNIEKTKQALARVNLSISAEDLGGNQGRSVWLYTDSGRITTKTAHGIYREL
jgi:chemotaxis protein CheD